VGFAGAGRIGPNLETTVSKEGVSVMFRDLDLSGVFTPTYFVSVLLMAVIAVVGLIAGSSISP
jgi:hypothetical protein